MRPPPRPRQTRLEARVPPSNRLAFGIAAAFALVLGAAVSALWLSPRPSGIDTATVMSPPRPLPELALIDQDGEPFTRESLRGRWTLVFAGFTACPDVCPTTLALLKQLGAELDPPPQVLFLSVDPQRDTPPRLKDYVRYFDPSFDAVTAPEPALAEAARAFGIAYARVPGAGAGDYSMDHSAMLVLVNPDAAIAAYILPPFQPAALKADLAAITGARA